MGKKSVNQPSTLGRALVKDRFGKRNKSGNSMLHTSELQDGQDWNRINFQSITEQTHLDDFLATAEMAGTEFQAEKLNMEFVRPTLLVGMPTKAEEDVILRAQKANRSALRIPRRPAWDRNTTAEELAENERKNFLSWRRSLVELQEREGILMTPFERNLEFWRQLWRVIERSDVVVQIVDARNPLLFRCEDLESYVQEMNSEKENLLLVNKSDFLTQTQREAWAKYFGETNLKAVFFSALAEEVLPALPEEEETKNLGEIYEEDNEDEENEEVETAVNECQLDLDHLTSTGDWGENTSIGKRDGNATSVCHQEPTCSSNIPQHSGLDAENSLAMAKQLINSPILLSRSQLVEVFRSYGHRKPLLSSHVTIGLVGYPNVGKSSTINNLLTDKKVSVSATPGKTKHFQTIFLSEDILLCDCPGLVFPAFVATKQEMIVSGILPIDQMKDHVPSVNLTASRIPRHIFEDTYGINLPLPCEGEDPSRPPTSEELLNTYGFMRGFMTQGGLPDNPRSSRYVLKDFVNGKLLYCHAPPSEVQSVFHQYPAKIKKTLPNFTPRQLSTLPQKMAEARRLERDFFHNVGPRAHMKGVQMSSANTSDSCLTDPEGPTKPWRQKNKREKKEKSRIKFRHLDT